MKMHKDIPAVVLDLSATGIGIVRSLRKKGINVYAFDVKGKYEIGRTNQAICGVCPSPVSEEADLLQFLTKFGAEFSHKPVLFAGSDDFVYFISKHRSILYRYYRFLLPLHSLVESVLDKTRTYDLALTHNIPCPKTVAILDDNNLQQIIHEVIFPCILKPVYSSNFRGKVDHKIYKKAIRVEDEADLREAYHLYRPFGELMIQEVIPGEESCIYSVKTLFDDDMNLIGLWMNQKIHQFPPDFGSSAMVISKRDEEVIEQALAFLSKIKMNGLAITEFKKDQRDGKLKFIEINPRIGLTQRLSTAVGVNLAHLYYLLLTDQKPIPVITQTEGIKWIYFVRDYISFVQKRRIGKMKFGQWLKDLSGKKVEALFAWNDPLPFIRSFISHIRNLWKRQS